MLAFATVFATAFAFWEAVHGVWVLVGQARLLFLECRVPSLKAVAGAVAKALPSVFPIVFPMVFPRVSRKGASVVSGCTDSKAIGIAFVESNMF